MPIELSSAQAHKVAELADELGGRVSLHQIAGGTDVYLSPAGGQNRYVVGADGHANAVEADAGAGSPRGAQRHRPGL
jgi:hypothetical protein